MSNFIGKFIKILKENEPNGYYDICPQCKNWLLDDYGNVIKCKCREHKSKRTIFVTGYDCGHIVIDCNKFKSL